PSISKRQQFKQINVEQKLLRHLDRLGLGMEKTKVEGQRRRANYRRGLLLPSMAGKGKEDEKSTPKTFDHPVWAVKRLTSASTLKEIPEEQAGLPEVALVGRSNVGKSTLLNALLGLQKVPLAAAKVSPKPGQTRSLDFYRVGKGKR
ncbi:unnamed protein product, partial [Choristocarpus tenellus]